MADFADYRKVCPNYAIIDLGNDGTGLDAVESIRSLNPGSKIG